jgi:hypothetical protein
MVDADFAVVEAREGGIDQRLMLGGRVVFGATGGVIHVFHMLHVVMLMLFLAGRGICGRRGRGQHKS